MGLIYGTGIHQVDLGALVSLLVTNYNGVLAKLDADGTVTDTNYASLWNVSDTVDSTGASLTQ
ncbi:MAG: hypothetical protein E6Q97_18820 [Desulfurellales bacterium]|nr:MAG: hypothetical protein E6Q97_18820 [Desulfurellales bacterium]